MRSGDRRGHRTGLFCSTHWPAQGWSKNSFTSRLKRAGTPSCVDISHTVAFHLHKANTALRFLFNIHLILNTLWIARASATATKFRWKSPSVFAHPPPPKYLQKQKLYFCYFPNLHKQNSTYHDLWICFMLESFICTKSWNSRRTVWIKGVLINVLCVLEIYSTSY
jgi:hypothetical protein